MSKKQDIDNLKDYAVLLEDAVTVNHKRIHQMRGQIRELASRLQALEGTEYSMGEQPLGITVCAAPECENVATVRWADRRGYCVQCRDDLIAERGERRAYVGLSPMEPHQCRVTGCPTTNVDSEGLCPEHGEWYRTEGIVTAEPCRELRALDGEELCLRCGWTAESHRGEPGKSQDPASPSRARVREKVPSPDAWITPEQYDETFWTFSEHALFEQDQPWPAIGQLYIFMRDHAVPHGDFLPPSMLMEACDLIDRAFYMGAERVSLNVRSFCRGSNREDCIIHFTMKDDTSGIIKEHRGKDDRGELVDVLRGFLSRVQKEAADLRTKLAKE